MQICSVCRIFSRNMIILGPFRYPPTVAQFPAVLGVILQRGKKRWLAERLEIFKLVGGTKTRFHLQVLYPSSLVCDRSITVLTPLRGQTVLSW